MGGRAKLLERLHSAERRVALSNCQVDQKCGNLMRKLLCIVLSVTAMSAIAGPIKGVGATNCGKWIEDRQNETYYPQLNWILGFISSYNYYVYVGKHENGVFGSADFVFVSAWMDNYCQKNPGETIFAGALKLMQELRSHAG